MKTAPIYEDGHHRWWIIYDQNEQRVIDSNVYVFESEGQALILDPGGFETFPHVFSALVDVIEPHLIKGGFVSHQDPDIASSLPLWNACLPKIQWYVPKLWDGFIRHYGALDANFHDIPDEGEEITIGAATLRIIPAHYLHSSANFHVYDPKAKLLFSGDVGAALLPPGHGAFVDRRDDTGQAFAEHISKAEYFHRRWMPSNKAKNDWIDRVSSLDIDFLCPQHGSIYTANNVDLFFDWFKALEVGILP